MIKKYIFNKNTTYLKTCAVIFAFLSICVLLFQNCDPNKISTSVNVNNDKGNAQQENSQSISYDRGSIYFIDEQNRKIEDIDSYFSLDSTVRLKFFHTHPNSRQFKWTITRGFQTIVNEVITTSSIYEYQLTQPGVYNVLVKSYDTENQFLSEATKRLIVDQACYLADILDFELHSGSLVLGQSASFRLSNTSAFSSIQWRIILPFQEVIILDDATATVNIPSDLSIDSMSVEVVANPTAASQCITYRKKEFSVNREQAPYFSSSTLLDSRDQDIATSLENNNIYHYARPSSTYYIGVHVESADTCSFQIDPIDEEETKKNPQQLPINCIDGKIEVSANSEGCQEFKTTLIAKRGTVSQQKSYYSYCGKNENTCFFGNEEYKPSHHICRESSARTLSSEDAPINGVCNNTITNRCQAGVFENIEDTTTHYKWSCVGQYGGTTASDCQKAKSVNGVCDNNTQNGCQSGEANDAAIADTSTHYKWHCVGEHDGTTATNCQKTKSVNGVCDNNTQNGCQSGEANDAAIADTSTHYKWHCVGEHGGTTATNCQKAKSVNGVCDNNTQNGCQSGEANDSAIADTSTHYKWHCVGVHGGTTATNCQKAKSINGVCNNAITNRCQAGVFENVEDTTTHYKWHCVGQHGGTTANNCQKLKSVNGACNNAVQNGCQSGTLKDIQDITTHYKWHCVGQHGGTTATNCQKLKSINGACNNAIQNSCQSGTLRDIQDITTHYKWQCVGQHGGTTATNCQKIKPINGACNNAVRNGCTTGTANDLAIVDTETLYKWSCVGQQGGTTASNCQKLKPINGACNNAVQNGCQSGTLRDIQDITTHYKWQCVGQHGGTTATNCQKIKPINGACNNAVRNGCTTGTANDLAVADTGTLYKWSCVGQHGGTTASNCQKLKSINGACNNKVRNGCTTGTANAAAIADTSTLYKWSCVGQHGGTTASNCQKLKPINGACNNAVRNGCTTGTANDLAVADTGTLYKWSCVGQQGGTTASNCQKLKPINGACNNAVRNGCTTGTANDLAIADTGTLYKWSCVGQQGGTTASNCQKIKPINGACNNAVRNGCTTGTANDLAVADTGTLYKWSCVGQQGGTTANNCQKLKPVNGACNNAVRNGCTTGTANDLAVADTGTLYKWLCVGQQGGTTASNCQKLKPINGACNNAVRNGCTTGTANDLAVADTGTLYKWSCVGQQGGTTASNCQKLKPINGACNNAVQNGCQAGQASSRNIASTTTHYKWQCVGQHGGTTANNCQKLKPVNGACNNAVRNGCTTGTANDLAVADTGTLYKWSCVGQTGWNNCQ